MSFRPTSFLAVLFLSTLACAAPAKTLEALLGELRQSGVDIIYSSELVRADMLAPPGTGTPLQQARQALAAN